MIFAGTEIPDEAPCPIDFDRCDKSSGVGGSNDNSGDGSDKNGLEKAQGQEIEIMMQDSIKNTI